MSTEETADDVGSLDSVLSAPDDQVEEYAEQTYEEPQEEVNNDSVDDQAEETSDDYDEEAPEDATEDELDESEEEAQGEAEETPEASLEAESEEVKDDISSKIFAPFKANGKTIQVDNADDAVKLMQMGANYSKKMAELKPHLKTIKVLKNQNLLDESKLNTLIDAANGDKGAIKKLAEMNDIDLYDLSNGDDESEYTPKTHSISDEDYAFEEVVEELKTTDSYSTLVSKITKDFDDKSKVEIRNNPTILKTLNDHVASGLYDDISNEVAQLRTLGKVPADVPDVEVYGQIYKAYTEAMQQPPSFQQQTPSNTVKNSDQTSRQKKAIARTKKSKGTAKPKMSDLDILNMPDDAFDEVTGGEALYRMV